MTQSVHTKGSVPAAVEIEQFAILFNAGRHVELESRARELLERHPDSGLIWKALGASLLMQGKDALPAMQKAAELLPDDAQTHSNLGNSLRDLGRPDDAVASYRRALAIKPDYAEAHGNLGIVLQDLGRLDDAVASYRRALAIKPEYAKAHNNLGNVLRDLGRLTEAVESHRKALAIEPEYAEAHNNLGNALRDLGRLDDAVESHRKALAIEPEYAEAHNNLGNALRGLGRLTEAEASYHRALAIEPEYAEAHNNLGNVLRDLGRLDDAVASYRRALAIKPDYAEAHSNLGIVLQDLGRLDDAVESHCNALAIKPDCAEMHSNLGIVLQNLGRLEDAVARYRRALAIKPDYAEAHNNLGNALRGLGRLTAAEASYRRALAIEPDYPKAHGNLGAILQQQGRLDEAESSCRRALALEPDYEDAFGNLLFALNYHPDKSAEEIFAAYREYDARFGIPHRNTWRTHANDRNMARRLKIGYVSPDFKHHSMRHFLEPLLAHHDKQKVEVYAYSEEVREDAVTARYRGYADHWIFTRSLTDDVLAERIRAEGIDILVDLAGHTGFNRLGVFARKPAPILVSWLGYGYTTGLTAVDYLLTDDTSAPAGSESLFSEKPWRLETPGYAYRPAEGMGLVSSLPALTQGFVTFGTLSRAVRINHRVVRVWAEILKRVDNALLVVDSTDFQDPVMQANLVKQFAIYGVGQDRLEIGCHTPPWDVLRRVDIGLDCFPHNSGTTLFETLYMGVPYVTLASRPSVGRLGSSILKGVGHPEWIAQSEADYVDKAAALASDLPGLAALRTGLRSEMEASSSMDEPGFARKVEVAYRMMFANWAKN